MNIIKKFLKFWDNIDAEDLYLDWRLRYLLKAVNLDKYKFEYFYPQHGPFWLVRQLPDGPVIIENETKPHIFCTHRRENDLFPIWMPNLFSTYYEELFNEHYSRIFICPPTRHKLAVEQLSKMIFEKMTRKKENEHVL